MPSVRRIPLLVVIATCAALAIPGDAELRLPASVPQNSQTLSVDVDLVLMHAIVTDPKGNYVTGLDEKYFQIWEDKVQQDIQYFSAEDVALSAGILLDVSGSMKESLSLARNAAIAFLRMGNIEDEYFLIEFGSRARLIQGFTPDISELRNRIAFTKAEGSTALYDAVYLGLDNVTHGINPRKALVLITDGQDNHSRYSFSNIKEFAKERDIQIYAIGITDAFSMQTGTANLGRAALNDLTQITGGRAFFPDSIYELEKICARIGMELKNQYVLGYKSTNPSKDGKWRKVQVKLNKSKGMPRMDIRARRGYYASGLANAAK